MRIYKNIPKRILSLCLVFAIGISMGVLSDHFVSENSSFQTFTEKLFRSEVCSNTLTLHYTLAHPGLVLAAHPGRCFFQGRLWCENREEAYHR